MKNLRYLQVDTSSISLSSQMSQGGGDLIALEVEKSIHLSAFGTIYR